MPPRRLVSVGFIFTLAFTAAACGRSDLFSAHPDTHCAPEDFDCVEPDGGAKPDGATDGPVDGPKGGQGGGRAGSGGQGGTAGKGGSAGGGAGRGGAGGRAGAGGAAGRGGAAGGMAGRGGTAGGLAGRGGTAGGMAGRGGAAGGCPTGTRELCDNGKDDNCNLLSDCQDPSCFGDPFCAPPGQEICNNTLDDDDDGKIDCADPDCVASVSCKPSMGSEICDNGSDDNNNRLSDCADPQCTTFPGCLTVACTPELDFGTIAAHGANVARTFDTAERRHGLRDLRADRRLRTGRTLHADGGDGSEARLQPAGRERARGRPLPGRRGPELRTQPGRLRRRRRGGHRNAILPGPGGRRLLGDRRLLSERPRRDDRDAVDRRPRHAGGLRQRQRRRRQRADRLPGRRLLERRLVRRQRVRPRPQHRGPGSRRSEQAGDGEPGHVGGPVSSDLRRERSRAAIR